MSAVDNEICRQCGTGFVLGMDRVHMNNGGVYHTGCVDGAYEYERGKMHGAEDRKMIEKQNQKMEREVDRMRHEMNRVSRELGKRGLVDLADDLRLAARPTT